LGMLSGIELLRQCEIGGATRQNACSLFWTLGGNQVGRAAIAGWKEVVAPAVRELRSEVGVWPFDGTISSLMESKSCVIAETYPADACVQIGLPPPGRGWSKRRQADRLRMAPLVLQWVHGKSINLNNVEPFMNDGFGQSIVGEDQFDAFVGLLAMLAVVLGHRVDAVPASSSVRKIEGWILGQSAANTAD
jgi:hypothetical protein